jgi:hypothetical protein
VRRAGVVAGFELAQDAQELALVPDQGTVEELTAAGRSNIGSRGLSGFSQIRTRAPSGFGSFGLVTATVRTEPVPAPTSSSILT